LLNSSLIIVKILNKGNLECVGIEVGKFHKYVSLKTENAFARGASVLVLKRERKLLDVP